MARRLDQQSTLGSYLDPLADKVLICSVVAALGIQVQFATVLADQREIFVAPFSGTFEILLPADFAGNSARLPGMCHLGAGCVPHRCQLRSSRTQPRLAAS
jgi:hypothetical protein